MIPTDLLFDAYLDTNILLAEAFLLWCVACLAVRLFKVRFAARTELWLLNGVFLTVLLSPILVASIVAAREAGMIPGVTMNLTDMLLAQFLNGKIEMAATDFEQVLSLRDSLTWNVARFDGLLGQTIGALLVLGAALFTAQVLLNIARLRRTIRSTYRWRSGRKFELRLSDTVSVPFSTRGLFRRYIVVPAVMLERPADLRIVLQHEFQHLRRGDIEWEIALECLRPFFFWNPVFRLWKRRVEELREFAVDTHLLTQRKVSLEAYTGCLLRVCEDMVARRAVPAAGPAVGFVELRRLPAGRRPTTGLQRRIAAMLDGERQASRSAGWLVLAALVLTLGVSALAIQKPPNWTHDRLMLDTIVNLERLDAINAGIARFRP